MSLNGSVNPTVGESEGVPTTRRAKVAALLDAHPDLASSRKVIAQTLSLSVGTAKSGRELVAREAGQGLRPVGRDFAAADSEFPSHRPERG